jgi:SnoaL-like protein
MSQQNVEFALDWYTRWNAGERPATLVPESWHTDAEYHVAREDPDSAVHHGIDAIRKQMESWIDAYPDLKLEPLDGKANGDQVLRVGSVCRPWSW